MGFKKVKINKKYKSNSIFINLIGLIFVVIIVFIGFNFIKNINFIKLDIFEKTKKSFVANNNDEKVDNINRVNILIVGRGGGNHDAPNLTDTIILANINFDTQLITMLSIPRDLYVNYGDLDGDGNGDSGKINQIYAIKSYKNDSKQIGMEALKLKVEEITKQKIDYYINIDFNGFVKLIDTIGGIEITIPEQFVDYEYPDSNWGYKTIIFKKGTWLFDGENALKYARSRHSTSDFDRGLRQQQIIDSIRKKLTAGYFLSSPLKIKEIYNVFLKYIHTNIELQDILKLAIKVKTSKLEIQSFNLNDSCFYGSSSCNTGGFLYVPNRDFFGGASVLLIDGTDVNNLNNYNIIHKFTNLIFNNPDLYQEKYKINVFNSLNINFLASLLSDEIKKYGFNIPIQNSIGSIKTPYENSIIYYNNILKDSKTIKALENLFPKVKFEETTGPKFSKELDTNIEFIIGEDYKEVFNNIY